MHHGTFALLITLCVTGLACTSPVEVKCAKQTECGVQTYRSHGECLAVEQKIRDFLEEHGGCDEILEKQDRLDDCLNGLTCEQFSDSAAESTWCPQEWMESRMSLTKMHECQAAR